MRFLKIAIIVFVSIFALGGIGVFFGVKWVNNNLESLINSNPDRTYNIKFQTLDFNYLSRVIFISEVTISPVGDQEGVFVDGRVDQVELNQLNLWRLFVHKELVLKELVFVEPLLVVYVPEDNPDEQKAGEGLKSLFGDILSRGKIENFRLGQAGVQVMRNGDQIGTLSNFNIHATELETDSLKWNNPIPFDYGRILVSIDSADHKLASGQLFKSGKIAFDSKSQELKVISPSMKYGESLIEASSKMEFQVDLIEFELDSLVFSGLEANSNLYSYLDIRARKLEVSGLKLDDFRNKNIPRPPDEYKPLFQGLVQKISFPLKLDTLRLLDGAISYGEAVAGKNETWKFQLDQINGTLVNVTSIPEYQESLENANADFTAKIDGEGEMTIDIDIPYDRDEFDLNVVLTDFPLVKISEILNPLMNGKIETGDLRKLEILMHADSTGSSNQFTFDYADLKLEMFGKNGGQKNGLKSLIANVLLNQSNLPGEKNYLQADFFTVRNQYRGPFHLIWNSTKDGMMRIVPGNAAREIMNLD